MGVLLAGPGQAARPLVIAHRGASGYLPEHTLPAVAMAHALGADFIEQDVVLSRDAVPIVLHDIHLDAVTDVARVFPERRRQDNRYYAIDFDLAELKRLAVHERVDPRTGRAVFPQRFPAEAGLLRIPTLVEQIQLIQGLNRSTGRQVGVYVEIKAPAWHRQQGHDLSRLVLDVLARHGYTNKDHLAFVQCFDPAETRRLREQLGCRLRLVQLIGSNTWREAGADFDQMRTAEGLRRVAEYADGIGPWMPHVVTGIDKQGRAEVTDLVRLAHERGLFVHPYTFRRDELPAYASSFEQCVKMFVEQAGVDGLFTDFPDLVR
ncbi:MAG: glycerophosphodiester phosphodiesterase [Pirellulaceae bacterium]|nr:glycerophosphodiester phosphodiesterase [Pirellulaceae bacterium]